MLNSSETEDRIKSAEDALSDAKKAFNNKMIIPTIQLSQVCIEQSAKAVIACFAIPEWEHDPSKQLLSLLELHKTTIIEKCGEELFNRLNQLSEDSHNAAPWHEYSVYGKYDKATKRWIIPRYICTEEIATSIFPLSERSYNTAKKFIDTWFSK